jgi:hypothetical protein
VISAIESCKVFIYDERTRKEHKDHSPPRAVDPRLGTDAGYNATNSGRNDSKDMRGREIPPRTTWQLPKRPPISAHAAGRFLGLRHKSINWREGIKNTVRHAQWPNSAPI